MLPAEIPALYLPALVLLSYFIGSIPFGYLSVRMLKGIDLRKEGSGSTGATNVSRILGSRWFFIISILDVLKGVLTVWLASFVLKGHFQDPFVLICGFLAIIGHIFPVWLGFHGGKGVNTTLGVLLMASPIGVIACLTVFIVVFSFSRYISLSSISAGLFFPFTLLFQGKILKTQPSLAMIVISFLVPVLILITHRHNIKRLLRNEENPFGKLKDNNK